MNNLRSIDIQGIESVNNYYKVTLVKTISFVVASQKTKDNKVHVVENVDCIYIHETILNDIDFEIDDVGQPYLLCHDLILDASLPFYYDTLDKSYQYCPSRVFLTRRPLLTIEKHFSTFKNC